MTRQDVTDSNQGYADMKILPNTNIRYFYYLILGIQYQYLMSDI